MSYLLVLTTVPSLKIGRSIAHELLNKKLAACVQILPSCESHYRWKGKIERASEFSIFIKTRAGLFKRISKEIKLLHPYEIPEIIACELKCGDKDYLEWISREVSN